MNSDFDRFKAFYQTSSFWQGTLGGLKQFSLNNFDFTHLKTNPKTLELPSIPMGTVLGKRAEYFFKFCAQQSSNYQVLLANEQIYHGGRTLGEIDYLLLDQQRHQIIHVELVYKFYIYEPGKTYTSKHLSAAQNAQLSNYVGPNRRDYFIKKFDHLKNQQLPLLHQPQTIEHLEGMGISPQDIEQQVCFLAHVYIPRELWSQDFKYLNKRCIQGYYMDEHAFAKAETTNTYYLPEKKQWKMRPQPLEVGYTFKQVQPMVQSSLKNGFAPMVWMALENNSIESFFIVKAL